MLWAGYVTASFVLVWDIPQITELLKVNVIVGFTGYFLLGYYISILSINKRRRTIFYILGILGAVMTIVGNIVLSKKEFDDEKFLSYLSPFVAMMASSLFVLIKENGAKIKNRTKCFIEYVRKDLFGIYLTHGIWLIVFNRFFFRNLADHLISLPIITLVIFTFSLYTTKIIRKIPSIKRFVE